MPENSDPSIHEGEIQALNNLSRAMDKIDNHLKNIGDGLYKAGVVDENGLRKISHRKNEDPLLARLERKETVAKASRGTGRI